MRLGLFGGTFDPIHQGHIHLIQQILDRNMVDEVLVVPAGNPWMRSDGPIASAMDRLAMVELALSDLPARVKSLVGVCECEVRRSGPTYTIDTVEELYGSRPDVAIVIILGSDAAAQIDKWHRSAELRNLVEVLMIARDGEGLDIDALDLSSTKVRQELLTHHSVTGDIPANVLTYIKEHNLYAS